MLLVSRTCRKTVGLYQGIHYAMRVIDHNIEITDHNIEMQQAKAQEIALHNLPLKLCVAALFF
jgi:hypothetical protein